MSDTDPVPAPPRLPSGELELAEMVGQLAASTAHMSRELIDLHETLRGVLTEQKAMHETLRHIRHAEAVVADGVLKLRQDTIDLDARLATIEHMPSIADERARAARGNGSTEKG